MRTGDAIADRMGLRMGPKTPSRMGLGMGSMTAAQPELPLSALGSIPIDNTAGGAFDGTYAFPLSQTETAKIVANVPDLTRLRIFDGGAQVPFYVKPVYADDGSLSGYQIDIRPLSIAAGATRSLQYDNRASSAKSNGATTYPDFFEDWSSGVDPARWTVALTGTKVYYNLDDWQAELQFDITGPDGGLCGDADAFYYGKDNGAGIDGTIYKLNKTTGATITSFPGPDHCNGGSFRLDNGNMLWNSAGGAVAEVWEIATDGTIVRKYATGWQGSVNGAYYAPGKYIARGSYNGVTSAMIYSLNVDGSVTLLKTHPLPADPNVGRSQSLYFDPSSDRFYYIYEYAPNPYTDLGGVSVYYVNPSAADGIAITKVDEWERLPSSEQEGITKVNGEWFFSSGTGQVFKVRFFDKKFPHLFSSRIGSQNVSITSAATFGTGYILGAQLNLVGDYPRMGFSNDIVGAERLLVGHGSSSETNIVITRVHSSSSSVQTSTVLHKECMRNLELKRGPTTIQAFENGSSLAVSAATNQPTGSLALQFGILSTTADYGRMGPRFVYVRKFAAIEPTLTAT